ncbi:hypothetical protein GCM10028805_38330 [Spirosoma harenae]
MANQDKTIAPERDLSELGDITNTPIADMDDTTGSNGGSPKDRFLDEADDDVIENESFDDFQKPHSNVANSNSTADTGGTGDAYTALSAGRSQY